MNGQDVIIPDSIQSITINSLIGAYQFDDKGTTKGKKDEMKIIFLKSTGYAIDYWKHTEYSVTYKPQSHNTKEVYLKKYSQKPISKDKITSLIESLQTYEHPKENILLNDSDRLESKITWKSILKSAKLKEIDWRFKKSYSSKEKNKEFLKACQSIDTFQVYLTHKFDTTFRSFVTDYTNRITIKIITTYSEFNYVGEYPNPAKQPWYNQSDTSNFLGSPVLNFNINQCLLELLPTNFLLRNSLSLDVVYYDYINWYFERRGMTY